MLTGHRRAGRRTSSHSDHGQGCVAVDFIAAADSAAATHVEISHSKLADSPTIVFTTAQWNRWLEEVASDNLTNSNGCVAVTTDEVTWRVTAQDGAVLLYNKVEWTAFRDGIIDREFDPAVAFAVAI